MPSTRRVRPERRLVALLAWLSCCTATPRAERASSIAERPPARVAVQEVATPDVEPEIAEEDYDEDEPHPELAEGLEDDEPLAEAAATARPHPLDGWSAERIAETVREDLPSLGSLSIGSPSAGALIGGVQAQPSELYETVAPHGAFGTAETLEYLAAAIRRVHAQFPNTPPLSLGHISARQGGPLSPHLSHQSGRDLDISFYYTRGARWYARATRENLDLPRTWAFVRALVTETDVEMILLDHSIQALLRRHALEVGEDPEWVESVFQGVPGKLRPIVRHAPGHATHIHVRFYNPIAQESARRCHAALVSAGHAREIASFVRHRARRGDTLGKLAKKYGVSVEAIKAANGLRKSLIREKREYRIPIRAQAPRPSAAPLTFPPRRLPPEASAAGPARSEAAQ